MEAAGDTVLVQRCKTRDVGAFRELVEEYRESAYGFAFSYLRNSEDALSVSQEAFVRVWEHIMAFREGGSFRSWLFGIVRHLALDCLEHRKRRREFSIDAAMEESGFDISDPGPDPHETLETRETRALVWKAIMGLREDFREIIVLKHFHDLTYREIAETLGIPEGTVMSRLFHARAALKKRLEPVLFGE